MEQGAQQLVQIRLPRLQDSPAQRIQRAGLCSQVCLPCPFGHVRVGHGGLVELLGQRHASARIQRDALPQQGEQVVEDLRLAGMWRLHPEQQAADTLDLTKGTEHRVAELQLYPQPLVNRPLQQLREQPPGGFAGRR